jgi:hypothetical protein
MVTIILCHPSHVSDMGGRQGVSTYRGCSGIHISCIDIDADSSFLVPQLRLLDHYVCLFKIRFLLSTLYKAIMASSTAAQQSDNIAHAISGAGGGILSMALT